MLFIYSPLNYYKHALVEVLTVNGERDFGLHGRIAERIAGFASESSVVVARLRAEDVDVAGLAARRFVRVVDLDVVLEPDDLSQRVPTTRDALQFHFLTHPHSLAFRVTDDLRLSGRI